MVPTPSTPRKPAVSGPRQQAWIRALDRARMVSTRKPVYMPRLDAYRVYSARADQEYQVSPVEVDGTLTYECECQAGQNGQVCWHAALVAALPGECARRHHHCAAHSAERAPSRRTFTAAEIAALQADCERVNARVAAEIFA